MATLNPLPPAAPGAPRFFRLLDGAAVGAAVLLVLALASAPEAAAAPAKAREASARPARPAPAKARPQAAPKGRAATPRGVGAAYATRADAMRSADDIAERRGLDRAFVRQAIGQARFIPSIPRLVLPAPGGTAKNWRVYRSRFIDPVRIAAGVAFWQEHAALLARAEQEYGIPAEIIVGIIGVETIFGRQTGGFRVMDALATLSFDFPAAHPRAAERQAFFQGELEQLLTLAQRAGTDPLDYRGSYAGAMGWPQFMPSSWARYAVDFDGDGKIDLFNQPADVIGSVANYFKAFGWETGQPTHFGLTLAASPEQLEALLAHDILPTFSAASMAAKGVVLDAEGQRYTKPLALVELQNGSDAPRYLAGTQNFYVVTRYNWSSYYAMSVIELGREIAAARAAR